MADQARTATSGCADDGLAIGSMSSRAGGRQRVVPGAPAERLMRRARSSIDGSRILKLSADPLADALDVAACDGDVSELLDAVLPQRCGRFNLGR